MSNTFELEITTALADGRGLGRFNNQAILVENALPGQVVEAEIIKSHPRWAEARVVSVVRASAWERPSPCIHAATCGGCSWQGLQYPMQLKFKQAILQDALSKIGRLNVIVPPVVASPKEFYYRNKMEFAGVQTSDGLRLGLHQRRSSDIVPITDCLLQTKRTKQVLATLESLLHEYKLTAWDGSAGQLRFVVIREPALGGLHVELILSKENAPKDLGKNLSRALRQVFADLSGLAITRRVHKTNIAYGEHLIYQTGGLKERVGYLPLELGPQSFFQVNTLAAANLYEQVKEFLPEAQSVWDLYCGVGGIGLYLRPQALLGIDSQPEAIVLANINAQNRGHKYQYIACSLPKFKLKNFIVPAALHKPQAIVVDPPRAGLHANDISLIKSIRPQNVVYVSCDPATLARDLALLAPQFEVQELKAFDLFPQTPHVETVCLLKSSA